MQQQDCTMTGTSLLYGLQATAQRVDKLLSPGFRAPFLVSAFLQVACAMIHQNLATSLMQFLHRGLYLLSCCCFVASSAYQYSRDYLTLHSDDRYCIVTS